MVMNFTISIFLKISSIMQSVHSCFGYLILYSKESLSHNTKYLNGHLTLTALTVALATET